jgi:hypothetical protein
MSDVLQHDTEPPHSSSIIMLYLNMQFPNQWIGHGSAQELATTVTGSEPTELQKR